MFTKFPCTFDSYEEIIYIKSPAKQENISIMLQLLSPQNVEKLSVIS